MICSNCGAPWVLNEKFCRQCGGYEKKEGTPAEVFSEEAPPSALPEERQAEAENEAAPAEEKSPLPVKKKKKKGLIIFLSLLAVLVLVVVYFFASATLLPPRDLGITYGEAERKAAVEKVGTVISYKGLSGGEMEQALEKDLSEGAIADFTWHFSNYEKTDVTFTQEEFSALVNNPIPGLNWLSGVQIKAQNGDWSLSAQADVKRLSRDVFSDVVGQIPNLPSDKINIFASGEMKIINNTFVWTPAELSAGSMQLQSYMNEETTAAVNGYMERLYKIVPDIYIERLEITEEGIRLLGTLPKTLEIKKN